VRSESGVVTSKAAAETARGLEIEFHDGRFELGAGKTGISKAPPKEPKKEPGSQGSLF
jgi:exodeoxyribonuclease VII large subunit